MVGWLVDRYCPVWMSDREVIRTIRGKLQEQHQRDPAMREERKKAYRIALDAHRENQETYRYVMGGMR